MAENRSPVLTLRNIYRIMTRKDVFVASYPVWGDYSAHGQTLHSFWLDFFQAGLSPNTDLTIFEDPSMRRTLNRLMNRSGGAKLLFSWFAGLVPLLQPVLLENMTVLWISLLNQHHSNQPALAKRLKELARLIVRQEDLEDSGLEQFLAGLILDLSADQSFPAIFQYAYALSWLSLCAIFGTRAGCPEMSALQAQQEHSRASFCQAVLKRSLQDNPVAVLSADSPISASPLPDNAFIGRAELLHTACRTFESGCGKLAVCGLGGIGKTEFARQLIRRLLLTLLSILPFRYWLPEELVRFAGDISSDREELADLSQILCDLGFLMRSEAGYAIHPMISETVRLSPVSAIQFPELWNRLSQDVETLHPLGCRVLISIFLHTDDLDITAVRCMAVLERTAGFLSFLQIPEAVYEKQRQFLDSHDHDDTDELDWNLACGIRDILIMSTRSTFAVSLWLGKEYDKAFVQYEDLSKTYRQQKREESLEYVMMRNNTALLLMDLGRAEEAEAVILEVLSLDSKLLLAQDIIATHQRNAAFILVQNQKWASAEAPALHSVRLRQERFGADSPWTADAKAVYALVLEGMGKREQALEIIQSACSTMLQAWGPDHRHTQNAIRIREKILKAPASSGRITFSRPVSP